MRHRKQQRRRHHRATKAAIGNTALQTNGRFGTPPTILVNNAKIDLNDSKWLENAIAGK